MRNTNYHGTFPRIPGHEPVGTVVARGSEVETLEIAYARGGGVRAALVPRV